MDWSDPKILLLLLPALPVLWWLSRHSEHPMSRRRQRALLAVRAALVAVVALAVAAPALKLMSDEKAVIFVMDHSQSQGEQGMAEAYGRVAELMAGLDRRTQVGFISAGQSVKLLEMPRRQLPLPQIPASLVEADGAQSDLEAAVALARGLFPPGTSRRLVLVGDGQQTRGNLLDAAREAAISDIVIDAVPVAGQARPDARVLHLRPSRMRLHQGASLGLAAEVDSSLAGTGTIRLFENGIEVEAKPIELAVGERQTIQFKRTPDRRNLYRYQVRLEGFGEDALEENNEAMTLVDVQGRPLLLYVEGETDQASYLTAAMAQEGIQLDVRPAEGIPTTLEGLAGYDGIILSDVPAHRFSNQLMLLMRDYVEHLGGGLLMVGGTNSFGVGGYYRTPIEDVLPVKIKAPDKEQRHSVGLVLVIDRSGSMGGQKIELCKSAAIGTVELLSRKDYIGVVVFDSNSRWVVPITRVSSPQAIASQIATISSGGGTNIYPGMVMGQQGLNSIKARIKHMIVLTDGHSGGGDYQQLASQIASQKITISTVAVGSGSAKPLLQSIAAAGGGKYYETNDPNSIPRIFTQDTMVHVKRMIREETFVPQQVERHPMVKGWPGTGVPPLLGYVKTIRKATAQVPLVTDQGDPLLAHW
ncbi:MAG: VWA domain-containing protein, partial [Phycisphaerae bacterium]|nr:VWA domain-containing protein [Phycisphaerae bacterium]